MQTTTDYMLNRIFGPLTSILLLTAFYALVSCASKNSPTSSGAITASINQSGSSVEFSLRNNTSEFMILNVAHTPLSSRANSRDVFEVSGKNGKALESTCPYEEVYGVASEDFVLLKPNGAINKLVSLKACFPTFGSGCSISCRGLILYETFQNFAKAQKMLEHQLLPNSMPLKKFSYYKTPYIIFGKSR